MSSTLRKDKRARGERAGKTLEPRKRMKSLPKIRIESTGEEKMMKNEKRDENSPVETIDERLKRLHMNEIDG